MPLDRAAQMRFVRENFPPPRIPVKVPENASRVIQDTVRLINDQQRSARGVARAAGVCRDWIHRLHIHSPRVDNLEAVLNALGYELRIVKRGEQ